jgi:hypothetical protein
MTSLTNIMPEDKKRDVYFTIVMRWV